MINTISFPNLGWSFTINRVAFEVFGRPIFWYGIFITFAILIGSVYLLKTLPKQGVLQDDILNMIIYSVVISIICARTYYVIFTFDMFKSDLWSVFYIWDGGIAIYGAIIGAFSTVYVYCKLKKIDAMTVFDSVGIVLLLGQAIGRWGNFTNAEAYGGQCYNALAMTIENGGRVVADLVHPTFFYESMWNLAGVIFLMLYKKHAKLKGELFFLYIAIYGIGRGIIEGLRADSLMLGNQRISQWLAYISAIFAVSAIVCLRTKPGKKAK